MNKLRFEGWPTSVKEGLREEWFLLNQEGGLLFEYAAREGATLVVTYLHTFKSDSGSTMEVRRHARWHRGGRDSVILSMRVVSPEELAGCIDVTRFTDQGA